VAISIVCRKERNLLAELRESITADGARGQVRRKRFMESVFAEILDFIDFVGLADRVVDDPAFFGDVVHRELNRRRQTADDEVDLLLLDQFERAGRSFTRIELVVADKQFGLATVETAALVEFGNGDLSGADLILRFGAVRTRQRNGKANLDGRFLRLQKIDAKRRSRQDGTGAWGGGQAGGEDRSDGFLAMCSSDIVSSVD